MGDGVWVEAGFVEGVVGVRRERTVGMWHCRLRGRVGIGGRGVERGDMAVVRKEGDAVVRMGPVGVERKRR